MSLEQDLRNWDQKSASDIGAIYEEHCADASFIADLVQLAAQPDLETGATWLLKHHLEQGKGLDSKAVSGLFALAPDFSSWHARLHFLQCLPFLPISTEYKTDLEKFLRDCLMDRNKFVRAWAYNGFHEMSLRHPEYETESRQLIAMALRDEAPSVKARIRQILKSSTSPQ